MNLKHMMRHLMSMSACVAVLFAVPFVKAQNMTLWYSQPANKGMNEALPIGEGKFGGLVYANPKQERVVLNEISLWTGSELSSDDYDKMGSYQMLGELLVDMAAQQDAGAGMELYRRGLDLETAVHSVIYRSDGVVYRREAFASHADGVMVFKFSADRPSSCNGTVRLKGAHKEKTSADGNRLSFSGALDNGLKYETQVAVIHQGGIVEARDGGIEFKNCDSLILIAAAGTDYIMDYGKGYRGEPPHSAIDNRIAAASKKSYEALKASHIADYRTLFSRVKIDVGTTSAERLLLPIDKRKVLQAERGGDPDLEELLFQYGRYLLISCSRPGGLPANLQGLWNDSNTPPWHSDYHANINIQMNYWLAEPANLGECHEPLFDLIGSQLEPWRKATAREKIFQTPSGASRGWAVRTSHGIHGDEGWQWDLPANAWYCQHYWWHYVYGGDKEWLKTKAYPVMKEICEFWAVRLKTLPDGSLVVPNGWSPEHGPHEDGVSYCQQIVWDLFNNYATASGILDLDAEYRAKIVEMRDKLVGPKIGKWGQLQEWMTDRDDPNDHHRHTSHLFAVYPGQQIGLVRTPDFAAAAKKSLLARGEDVNSDVREWSFAWRTALYARLHDGKNAHRLFQQLFSDRNTCPNLFGLHPPMQIDGNFGITAGVCEMLLQSHEGEINLLPALPPEWPNGSVKGLRARGGFEVDIAWKEGRLVEVTVASKQAGKCNIRHGDTTASHEIKLGAKIRLDGTLKPF
jgi:alpha-L-fucosidase 2